MLVGIDKFNEFRSKLLLEIQLACKRESIQLISWSRESRSDTSVADGVRGEDIVRQTTSRSNQRKRGHRTMEEEDKVRTRGKTDTKESWRMGMGYLFCGEERNYFMGVGSDAVGTAAVGCNYPSSLSHPASLEKAHRHLLSESSRLQRPEPLFIRFSPRSLWFFYLMERVFLFYSTTLFCPFAGSTYTMMEYAS